MPDQAEVEVSKEILTLEEQKKRAYTDVLTFITNNFYRSDERKIEVRLSTPSDPPGSFFHPTANSIVLATGLIDAFGKLNIPRFIVYYHELGHYLYSIGLTKLEESWVKIDAGPLMWNEKYHHLLNWIEDFYIEGRLLKEHTYLTDVLTCIKKVPPEFNITAIEYAFNYFYVNQAPTPALGYVDQLSFMTYIKQLMTYRSHQSTLGFGFGILTTLSIKPSIETKYAALLIEFYNWCVAHKIFPPDKPLPSLQNPNNHLTPNGGGGGGGGGGNGQGGGGSGHTHDPDSVDPGQTPADPKDPSNPADDPTEHNNSGSSSKHSHKVGSTDIDYVEQPHIQTPTSIFKEELVEEAKLIDRQLIDTSNRVQSEKTTIDGLFATKYKDCAIIQPRPIIPNFFNPHRLVDQILFKEKEHAYMNVAIYRDVSGSVDEGTHRRMHKLCEKLYELIPVDITYYLYSSGNVSVVELPYIPWEDKDNVPAVYRKNSMYLQLGGGTNSDAIADVITQQLSDRWLNIIITDGDLNSLMARENIGELLKKNVFAVFVDANEVTQGIQGIEYKDGIDVEDVVSKLSGLNALE